MNRLLFATTSHCTQCAFLLPFARHFRQQGATVDALAQGVSSCPDCRPAFDHHRDIAWSRHPLAVANLTRAVPAVQRIVAEGRYDLVHVHTPVAAFVTRLALRRRQHRPPLIYTAHGFHFHPGGPPLRNALFRSLEQLAGRWTDYLVVMNSEDRQAAHRHRLLPADRIRYMPGIGIDIEHYRRSAGGGRERRQLRQSLGITEQAPLFLLVAELIPRKRPADALRALAGLEGGSAQLLVAGDGPLETDLRRLAGALGIADRVHFLGFRRDIPVLIGAATAVLLPSSQEGLPRCLMEAYCLGVPCIGSDIRGTRELVTAETGRLFPVGDVQALRDALRWVLAHPREARRRGEAGRRRLRSYELAQIIGLHEELYREALSARGRSAEALALSGGRG
jgi:glycosyltransferase involved in cell wall biosynthesis